MTLFLNYVKLLTAEGIAFDSRLHTKLLYKTWLGL
eukprot:SAG31_NODE_40468_length_280_cov_1.309392_1_plen_34_part_10